MDVGCADGLQAESLSSAGVLAGEDSRVCGIDFSERLLAVARGAGKYHSLVCDDLNRCDAEAEIDVATARFEDDAFHVSFCVGVLLANRDASMPQLIARTPSSLAARSSRSAALLVGVVSASMCLRIRPASAQIIFMANGCRNFGNSE